MDLQRRYSNLSYELRALPGKMMVAKSQWKSELANENDSKTNSLNKVVAEQGSLKLYPYSIKSSPETGTASVVGEVENSGDSAVTDVGIEFELFDSNNKSLGTASDFIGRIEPNSRWPFKALILGEEVKDAKFKMLTTGGSVIAVQGSLKLYPYSIKSSPETGTASVVGEVENSGDSAVTDVGIEFELFDSNNKSLGTASDFIGRIEPNSRWPFKALILGEEVKDAKFKSLKGLDKLAKEPNN